MYAIRSYYVSRHRAAERHTQAAADRRLVEVSAQARRADVLAAENDVV